MLLICIVFGFLFNPLFYWAWISSRVILSDLLATGVENGLFLALLNWMLFCMKFQSISKTRIYINVFLEVHKKGLTGRNLDPRIESTLKSNRAFADINQLNGENVSVSWKDMSDFEKSKWLKEFRKHKSVVNEMYSCGLRYPIF